MIAVSRAVADNFCGSFSVLQSRVKVILNAIEVDRFQPDAAAGKKTRDQLHLGAGDLLIGIVGQLTPRKGQLELVRAFARVVTELPNAMLLIVGAPLFNRDQEYAELIQTAIKELGVEATVRLTGARSDIPAVMQALDLLVVNSTVEPFGLVALEAMACNTPVIAAVSGGIPEIIEHNWTGWLIPQGDEAALADAILYLGRRPEVRSKLTVQGQNHVASYFAADRYLADLEAFYSSICDQRAIAGENSALGQTEAARFA